MENSTFYNHVSSWVRSHRNPETLDSIRNFVDRALQPLDIKEKLYREINYKETILRRQPGFTVSGDATYLANDDGNPRVYMSRFSAVCKLAELTLKGYEVELQQSGTQYRITLSEPAPVNGMSTAA
ncbi:MAG: hypothetical protein JST82_01275 [Bacteroidetes bacterium]|nr:hypothetical protein [Bacteroidota bacterium]